MARCHACPLNRIEAVTLHHNQDLAGRYIPMQFTVNSWVTLMPDLSTAWGRDSGRYPTTSAHFYWKAQIVGFEYGGPMNIVHRVIVRHAYEVRHLQLDPAIPQPRIPCNCKCTAVKLYSCFISCCVFLGLPSLVCKTLSPCLETL